MCKSFLRPDDLMILMDCSRTSAYNTIRALNAELKGKGAFVRPGRISAKYFCERMKVDPRTLPASELERKEA